MRSIRIIKPGMFTTIQDGGRKGLAYYAIPRSGFMDRDSAQKANILVGNKKNTPLLEMTYIGATIEFSEQSIIALTGADMQCQLNGQALKRNKTQVISKGSTLVCKNAINGVRGYLAIQGDWQVQTQYDSVATYTYAKIGGLNGTALQKNDTINIQQSFQNENLIIWKQQTDYNKIKKIKLQKGPEWSMLQNFKELGNDFSISPQNDRMGAILKAPPITVSVPDNFASQAIFPGVVQCTPSGKLIVVLQDGQTTGGYPRVGILTQTKMNLFNQLRIGQVFRFDVGLW